MVTASDKQQADLQNDMKARMALVIGLLITLVSLLGIGITWWLHIQFEEDPHMWITTIGVIGGLLSMAAVWRKKTLISVIIMLVTLYSIAAVYIASFSSSGTNLTIIMILFSVSIIVQLIPSSQVVRATVISLAVGVVLILLDQFWPGQRTFPPTYVELLIAVGGIATILMIIIIVVRQFSSYSLRGKLIGATLTVALLSVAAVALGVTYMTTNAITEEVGVNLATVADSQALALGGHLARSITGLNSLAINKTLHETLLANNETYTGTPDEIQADLEALDEKWATLADDDPFVQAILKNDVAKELGKYQIVFPDAMEVLVVDKYGGLVAATQRPSDFYEGEEDWFLDSYINGFGSVYLSNPVYDPERDDWLMYVAVPIHTEKEGGGGEISGILRAAIRLNALVDILAAGHFGETGRIELYFPFALEAETDDIGDMLPPELQAHLDEAIHISGSGEEDEIVLSITADPSGEIVVHVADLAPEIKALIEDPTADYFVADHHETNSFVGATAINTLSHSPAVELLEWTVAAFQESSESLQPVVNQQRINTILGIIVVIAAGTVAFYVGTRISHPISNLTDVAERVTAGDLTVRAEIESQDELGTLAVAFNEMTAQLEESISTLERRVADRTQALTISVEVGHTLSTIMDEDELVTAVVQQVRDSFNYYQAQIYLLDEDEQTLVMVSGTGEAGRQMIAQGHTLQVGAGMVGAAAQYNTIELAPDVSQEANWLPHPLLPDTKAEIAVPIAIGEEVLGVLDVQHHVVNRLQIEDAELLQSVSSQVAIALRNARLYQKTQQQAHSEALLRSINQKITSTTDMETAMKVAIRELGQALGTKQTIIRLGHHEAQSDAPPTTNGNNGKSNA